MTIKSVEKAIAAVNTRSDMINIRGDYNVVVSGTWEGTISILRRFPSDRWKGTHTGTDNASALTPSGTHTADSLIGMWVSNDTDGSFGPITDNGATVVATLAGGTGNDWDTGDVYSLWQVAAAYTANTDPQATEYENGIDLLAIASAWTSGTAFVRISQ